MNQLSGRKEEAVSSRSPQKSNQATLNNCSALGYKEHIAFLAGILFLTGDTLAFTNQPGSPYEFSDGE